MLTGVTHKRRCRAHSAPWSMSSLSRLLRLLSVALSASEPSADPSRAFPAPQTTMISGRLLDKYSLVPVGEYRNEDKDSKCQRAMLKEALGSQLGVPALIDIVAEYSPKSHARLFAEELYAELWEGRTDLLVRELYDVEKSVLKEPHHFWEYLSGAAPRVLVCVWMLWKAQMNVPLKQVLDAFAKLVGKKVGGAAYFVGGYLDGSMPFPLQNTNFDECPPALNNSRDYLDFASSFHFGIVPGFNYFLALRDAGRLVEYMTRVGRRKWEWLYAFRALHAVKPALLHRVFDIMFLQGLSGHDVLFAEMAPVALSIDPSLSSILVEIAKTNKWKQSTAEQAQAKLADVKDAGGNVHMQPLMSVAQCLDGVSQGLIEARFKEGMPGGLWFAASSTCKTAADKDGLQLHIAAGNVLCALSTAGERRYLHIRRFENGEVSTHALDRNKVKENVQCGDVIAVSKAANKALPFLEERRYSTGLSAKDRLESIKSFCYSAKSSVVFLAIVERDEPQGEQERCVESRRAKAIWRGQKRTSRKYKSL